jgi:hypothetical protein
LVFIFSEEERIEREFEEKIKKRVKRYVSKVIQNENDIMWPNPFMFPVEELSFRLSKKLKEPNSLLNELEYNATTSILLDKMLLLNR